MKTRRVLDQFGNVLAKLSASIVLVFWASSFFCSVADAAKKNKANSCPEAILQQMSELPQSEEQFIVYLGGLHDLLTPGLVENPPESGDDFDGYFVFDSIDFEKGLARIKGYPDDGMDPRIRDTVFPPFRLPKAAQHQFLPGITVQGSAVVRGGFTSLFFIDEVILFKPCFGSFFKSVMGFEWAMLRHLSPDHAFLGRAFRVRAPPAPLQFQQTQIQTRPIRYDANGSVKHSNTKY